MKRNAKPLVRGCGGLEGRQWTWGNDHEGFITLTSPHNPVSKYHPVEAARGLDFLHCHSPLCSSSQRYVAVYCVMLFLLSPWFSQGFSQRTFVRRNQVECPAIKWSKNSSEMAANGGQSRRGSFQFIFRPLPRKQTLCVKCLYLWPQSENTSQCEGGGWEEREQRHRVGLRPHHMCNSNRRKILPNIQVCFSVPT